MAREIKFKAPSRLTMYCRRMLKKHDTNYIWNNSNLAFESDTAYVSSTIPLTEDTVFGGVYYADMPSGADAGECITYFYAQYGDNPAIVTDAFLGSIEDEPLFVLPSGDPSTWKKLNEWVCWLLQRFKYSDKSSTTGKITVRDAGGYPLTEQQFTETATDETLDDVENPA